MREVDVNQVRCGVYICLLLAREPFVAKSELVYGRGNWGGKGEKDLCSMKY